MFEFVQVPVPPQLVPRVMRLVADFLGDVRELPAHPVEEPTWAEIAAREEQEEWWWWLRPSERELLALLKAVPGFSLEAVEAARRLDRTPSELAGILGPLQRRSRRDGYPSAVRSRQESARDGSGGRIKILSLETGVAALIPEATDDPLEVPPSPAPQVRKRAKSEAGKRLAERRRSLKEGGGV